VVHDTGNSHVNVRQNWLPFSVKGFLVFGFHMSIVACLSLSDVALQLRPYVFRSSHNFGELSGILRVVCTVQATLKYVRLYSTKGIYLHIIRIRVTKSTFGAHLPTPGSPGSRKLGAAMLTCRSGTGNVDWT
jgi:hypothetical protein